VLIAVAVIAYLVTVLHAATQRALAERGPEERPETLLFAWPKWLLGLLVLLLALWMLYTVRSILTPFLLGALVAYMMDPIIDRMVGKGVPRMRAISLVFLLFLVLVIMAVVLLVPAIAREAQTLAANYGDYSTGIRDYAAHLERLADRWATHAGVEPKVIRQAFTSISAHAQSWGLHVLQSLLGWLNRSLSLVFLLVVTPVVAFWLLRDYHNLGAILLRPLPQAHRQSTVEITRDVNRIVGSYMLGILIMTGLVATYSSIVLTALGVRFSVLLGVMTGVLSIIPYLGFPTAMVVIALTMLLTGQGAVFILIAVALHIAGNLVSDNLVYPRVIGGQVGLHPLVVIFAILAGGALLNFVGVLLAVPIAGIIKMLLLRFWPELFRPEEKPAPLRP
jgi:predicted PurR-regulated permease PerM